MRPVPTATCLLQLHASQPPCNSPDLAVVHAQQALLGAVVGAAHACTSRGIRTGQLGLCQLMSCRLAAQARPSNPQQCRSHAWLLGTRGSPGMKLPLASRRCTMNTWGPWYWPPTVSCAGGEPGGDVGRLSPSSGRPGQGAARVVDHSGYSLRLLHAHRQSAGSLPSTMRSGNLPAYNPAPPHLGEDGADARGLGHAADPKLGGLVVGGVEHKLLQENAAKQGRLP